MDLPSLAAILASAAFNPNPEERKAAYQSLMEISKSPGHLIKTLQIVVDDAGVFDLHVRHAACIHFKSIISRHWICYDDENAISLPAKIFVKDQILAHVSQVPPALRSQMGECLKTIIVADYPKQWTQLLDWVVNNLHRQQIHGALFVLRILSSIYGSKSGEEREPLRKITDATFPHLLSILQTLVTIQNPTLEAAYNIKLICKIFCACVYLELPRQMYDPHFFDRLMALLLNILERPVPVEAQPQDLDFRKSWGWWKTKKWVAHLFNGLYIGFGKVKFGNMDNRAFADMFQTNYAVKILEANLRLLDIIRHDQSVPDIIITTIFEYLSHSISGNSTYEVLEPRLNEIVFEIVFPFICFNDNDEILWKEEPHEFLRKAIYENIYGIKSASSSFIVELVKKPETDVNFTNILQFLLDIFRMYDEAPLENKPSRRKNGAMLAVGKLSDKFKQNVIELENILVQHVLPEFNSTVGHLRAKAAWVAGQYAGFNFTDRANFSKALNGVIAGLHDPELPVRVSSVLALRSFIGPCQNLDEILPVLPQLLDDILKLMNEVENQDITQTLEAIMAKYGEEIWPYALALCQKLASAFWKCINSDEKMDDAGVMAGAGCLRAISKILESTRNVPHLSGQIEPELMPIMQKMLSVKCLDLFQEVLEIVGYFTAYSPTISMEMWSLWPLIMDALKDCAIDSFQYMLCPLNNYISRGTEHFLACKEPDYQQILWDVVSELVPNKNSYEGIIDQAPVRLFGIVLQNCKGQVDHLVEPYLKLTLEQLQVSDDTSYKCHLFGVIANAFYYKATLALEMLRGMCNVELVLMVWLQMVQEKKRSGEHANFKREHEKKVCIFGLISVLNLPADQLPQHVFPNVYKALLDLLAAYKDQLAEAAKAEEEGEDEADESIDVDDEDKTDEDLTKKTDEKPNGKSIITYSDYEVDDDDISMSYSDLSSEESDDDEEDLDSPMDKVDPFVLFSNTISEMQALDNVKYQSLTQSLNAHYQELAGNILKYADQRMKEELEKKAT